MADAKSIRIPDDNLDYGPDLIFTYRGVPFTGVSYEERGSGLTELEYKDGLQHGRSAEWDGAGILRWEGEYRENLRHGTFREYDSKGRLTSEARYEYGVLKEHLVYNERGEHEVVERLVEGSPESVVLERFRRENY